MKKISLILLCFLALDRPAISQGSWQTIPSAPYGSRFDDIYFINDSVGFVGQSSNIYKTTDKGTHWNLIALLDSNIQYAVRSIEFINDTVGFAGLLYSSGPLQGNLFKTVDGGYSWTLLQNMQIQPSDGICGLAHFGNTLVAVGTFSQPAWFYRSDDFGLNWTKVDLSLLASGLVDCYMLNSDTILVSGIAEAANQYKATILKSFDGGATWQRVYLASTPNSYCWKMFFHSNGLGLSSVESGPPFAARTTDFGNTWTTQTVYIAASSSLGAIGLLNDTLGWVTDQYGFGTWQTSDGGLTWNSISSPVAKGDRLVVIDSAIALISGYSIYRYQPGATGIQITTAAILPSHELLIYPNPADSKITVEALAICNTFGLLDILDENGLLVQHVARQPFKKGKNTFNIPLEKLPSGNYKLLWRNNEKFLTQSFTIAN